MFSFYHRIPYQYIKRYCTQDQYVGSQFNTWGSQADKPGDTKRHKKNIITNNEQTGHHPILIYNYFPCWWQILQNKCTVCIYERWDIYRSDIDIYLSHFPQCISISSRIYICMFLKYTLYMYLIYQNLGLIYQINLNSRPNLIKLLENVLPQEVSTHWLKAVHELHDI